jgi:hypothetical protein
MQEDRPTDTAVAEAQASLLFAGDVGQLPYDTRRVLVRLLLGPTLDALRHSKLWPVLLRDESVIRTRLHELFLDLVVDRAQQVAYIRQVESGSDLEVPVLLRRLPLTFIDSALLLFLRQRLSLADAHGERAVVSAQEMIEHLANYERGGNTDAAKFSRQVNNAIERAKEHSLLSKLRGTDDRFEVSPTLKLVFSAEMINALIPLYAQIAPSARADDEPFAAEAAQPENSAGE